MRIGFAQQIGKLGICRIPGHCDKVAQYFRGNLPRIYELRSSASVGALIERPAGKGDLIRISFGEKVPYNVNSAGNRYLFAGGH